jgi:hypothetical protein
MYPQLTSGALSQFPIVKKRCVRNVENVAADGSSVKFADPAADTVEWQLQYSGIDDNELAALEQFFTSMEGSLNTFTFLDPNGNLLAWSGDLTNAVWTADPYLSLTGSVADPMGGTDGWHVSNSGAGAQGITQTLNTPVQYSYCFSVHARGAQPITVTLLLGSQQANYALGTNWSRISITGTGDATASAIEFGIKVPAGGAVDVFGPQVEPQQVASGYKTSTKGGIYQNARFRDDTLTFTTTDVNHHTATVNIFYAEHL